MSITADAIQKIAGLHSTAAASSETRELTDGLAVVLHNDTSVKSLESLMPFRNRFRGEMQTTSLSAYADYIRNRESETTKCFIDQDYMTARAIFNMWEGAQPGHCDDKATLSLQKTAAFKALTQIDGKKLSQKELAEWLEDWASNITVYQGSRDITSEDDNNLGDLNSPVHITKAINAIRKMTIETARKIESQDGDMNRKLSAMEAVEARTGDIKINSVVFTCKPYNNLDERAFDMRLSTTTGGDSLSLTLRIMKLEAIEEEIAEEFQEKLEASLEDTSVDFYIGSFVA